VLAGTPRGAGTLEVGAPALRAVAPTAGISAGRAAACQRVSPAGSHLNTGKGRSGWAAECQMRTKHALKKK